MRFEDIPVAPGGQGWLGHGGDFRADRMGVLRRLSEQAEPIMRMRVPWPGVRALAVNDPELVHQVLVEKARHFDKSDMFRFTLYPLGGEGLFTSNGELWRRQRRRMAPLFTPAALEAYAGDMVACALRTTETWRDGGELSLSAETTRLTMGIAGKTLFGADTFSDADQVGQALTVALDWASATLGSPFAMLHVLTKRAFEGLASRSTGAVHDFAESGRQKFQGPVVLVGRRGRELRRAVAFLDEHVKHMINDRRRTGGRGDLLARLIEVVDSDDGTAMSDRQVRDEVLTLFVAGHETTATALAWTLYFACKHPEVYAALEREADAANEHPTSADLPRLEGCLRAFKEALRLYPPVYMFARDSRDEVEVGGYTLPKRTNVLIAPYALHHAERLWPDAERFDPARFRPEEEAKRHRYAWLPFGAGPRVCLGMHFAYMEAQLVLATLLRRWRFELLADDAPEPGATLRAKGGVRVRVRRR